MKPAIFEDAARIFGPTVISRGHVFTANENFPIFSDLHFHSCDWFADRSLAGMERMVERDDRRGFGQSVTLNHQKSELAEERFQFRGQRRRAHNEAPKFPSEQPVHTA